MKRTVLSGFLVVLFIISVSSVSECFATVSASSLNMKKYITETMNETGQLLNGAEAEISRAKNEVGWVRLIGIVYFQNNPWKLEELKELWSLLKKGEKSLKKAELQFAALQSLSNSNQMGQIFNLISSSVKQHIDAAMGKAGRAFSKAEELGELIEKKSPESR